MLLLLSVMEHAEDVNKKKKVQLLNYQACLQVNEIKSSKLDILLAIYRYVSQ
jgi:hypothetical protein